ncbi:unnamed protein product [Parnassius apollo]|uniref:MICOS complex subunit MIC10 n=1 Tax=Parnassius apollo TaxID=110799 RepID=A0A8S3X9R0_PARAO|nr:unnamed protein product [Parnassius apollo]
MTQKNKDAVEDDYSAKLDMCLTDGIIKTGGGVALGALSSLLFLGRRRWPIIAGMGMGVVQNQVRASSKQNHVQLRDT